MGRQATNRAVVLVGILDIVSRTGRRITPVCSLRYQDLRLDQAKYGAICWPTDTDKMAGRRSYPSLQRFEPP